MNMTSKFILGAAALAVLSGVPAIAAETKAKVTTVTKETNTVTPEGDVMYESKTTVTRTPVKPGFVTFYYYDPKLGEIVAGNELTDDIIALWDTNNNKVIDNHEFYKNALVVYEPREYATRTYQDINGRMKLTKEEYTVRMQQLPSYRNMNKDKGEGLTLFEFTGVGFQDADHNNDNQVTYDELRQAFYAKEGVIRKPLKLNDQ